MRALEYVVGTKEYQTVCTTLASAKAQASLNPEYTVRARIVDIPETREGNLVRARKITFPLKPFRGLVR